MNTAKLITKGYFFGALAISSTHIVTSAHMMGANSYEPFVAPFMIDGFALLGLHMRNEKYDDRTNKIGLRAQSIAGLMSLAMNVHAADGRLFGILIGIAAVALFIGTEWMAGQIRLRHDAEAAAKAAADKKAADDKAAADAAAIAAADAAVAAANAWMSKCSHPTRCDSEYRCNTKTVATVKAAKTRARKARDNKAMERIMAG